MSTLSSVIAVACFLMLVAPALTKRENASYVSLATRQCLGQIKCYCSANTATSIDDDHRHTKPAIGFVTPDGQRNVGPKIIGGSVVTPHSHPHQISLQIKSKGNWAHDCGGSILKPDTILTAAHCIEGRKVERLRVVAGAHGIFNYEPTQQIAYVDWMMAHPKRNKQSFDYDYAIIRLNSSLHFDSNVQPIPLAKTEPITGKCTITGWGSTTPDGLGGDPELLLQVSLSIVAHSACAEVYSQLTDRMICAGDANKGSCSGDSGGPLVCGGKLAGIVSFGTVPCGLEKFPSVFASIAKERSWIEQQ